MSEVAETIYQLHTNETIRLHTENGDEVTCTLRAGDMRGDEDHGEWRWVAEHEPDGHVVIRIPFRDGVLQGVNAILVDDPDDTLLEENAAKVVDVERLGIDRA